MNTMFGANGGGGVWDGAGVNHTSNTCLYRYFICQMPIRTLEDAHTNF